MHMILSRVENMLSPSGFFNFFFNILEAEEDSGSDDGGSKSGGKAKIIHQKYYMLGSLQILVTLILVFLSFWLRDFLYFKFPFCLACLDQQKKGNKLLCNILVTSLPKQPKIKLPKWMKSSIITAPIHWNQKKTY